MINNTKFLYVKLGIGSFYGSIARIGVMDKKVIKKARTEKKKAGIER